MNSRGKAIQSDGAGASLKPHQVSWLVAGADGPFNRSGTLLEVSEGGAGPLGALR